MLGYFCMWKTIFLYEMSSLVWFSSTPSQLKKISLYSCFDFYWNMRSCYQINLNSIFLALQMHGNSFERKLARLKGKPQSLEVSSPMRWRVSYIFMKYWTGFYALYVNKFNVKVSVCVDSLLLFQMKFFFPYSTQSHTT